MRNEKTRILFLCMHNSCRSQMAEAWARRLKGDLIEPHSAGIEPTGLDPLAVEVMAEAGQNISSQRSKHLDELLGVDFDYIITVCDQARDVCPVFHGHTKVIHRGFEDPPKLARQAKTKQHALSHYRRVRDKIKAFIEILPEAL